MFFKKCGDAIKLSAIKIAVNPSRGSYINLGVRFKCFTHFSRLMQRLCLCLLSLFILSVMVRVCMVRIFKDSRHQRWLNMDQNSLFSPPYHRTCCIRCWFHWLQYIWLFYSFSYTKMYNNTRMHTCKMGLSTDAEMEYNKSNNLHESNNLNTKNKDCNTWIEPTSLQPLCRRVVVHMLPHRLLLSQQYR